MRLLPALACKRGVSHWSTPRRRPVGTHIKAKPSKTSIPYVQYHSLLESPTYNWRARSVERKPPKRENIPNRRQMLTTNSPVHTPAAIGTKRVQPVVLLGEVQPARKVCWRM